MTHSGYPLVSRGQSVSQVPGWTLSLLQRRPGFPVFGLVSLTLLPSLTACIQVPSSHCGAESNVTGPGCSVLPPPCKGPISAGGYHHTGSLGREWEGAVCERRGKCGGLGSQSGRPPAAYWDYFYFWGCVIGPVASVWRGQVCRVIKLQPGLCG